MALTAVDYEIFMALRREGVLPPRPGVLELGEAEWYGDLPSETLAGTIDQLTQDPALRAQLHAQLAAALRRDSSTWSWDLAKIFYRVLLDYRRIVAIDFHGTPAALKLDLNYPVAIDGQFEVLVNSGTGEHVFNVFQFFKTCHEVTCPGGIMVHSMPFCGWVEHGFYNFNPTFYWDLAAANGYRVVAIIYTELDPAKLVQLTDRGKILDMARSSEIGRNAILYAIFVKSGSESEFRIPFQAVYAGSLDPEMSKAWHELR
jgi:hypothetical protein